MRICLQKQSFLIMLLLSSFTCLAQNKLYQHTTSNLIRSQTISGQANNINVVYHRLNFRIQPDSPSVASPAKFLKGNVTTHFITKGSNTTQVTFDFNNIFTIDSVTYHGAKLVPANIAWPSPKILQLTFPTAILTTGTLDSLCIFYKGTPPAATGQLLGYQRGVSGSNNYVYTLSESYEDRDWWPCKHDMTDKIDSIDINVSVPSAFWVATNGKMIDSAISGSSRIFKFKHRYPIASYLVSLGIAKYNRYYRSPVNVNRTNVPVVYNLFPGKSTSSYNNILAALDKSKAEIIAFSGKYGDYPFKNEKHGYYEFGFGGGMEQQTFSGMGGSAITSWSTIAHELAHQWFGDKVTCATWSDLWLNEGFARYNEIVAAELVSGLGNPVTHRGTIKNAARTSTTTPVYISNIASSNTIWTSANTTAIYDKGCMVISMIRTLLGDTKFFQACNNYLNDSTLAYHAATTADLQRHVENQFGAGMNAFFDAWIYGFGIPTYLVNWNSSGNTITLQFNQSRSAGASVSYLPMPVVIKVANAASTTSTTLIMYDRGDSIFVAGNGIAAGVAGHTISFNLSFTPSTVTFDPSNVTIATGSTSLVSSLKTSGAITTKESFANSVIIYPNPTADKINIVRKGKGSNAVVSIINIKGETVLRKNIFKEMENMNIQALQTGSYFIQIIENGFVTSTNKLIIKH